MDSFNFIDNRIGYVYNFAIRIGGYVIALMGGIILLTQGWGILAGILLLLAGLYFATTATGILIDPQNKSVRHYTSYFGMRYGRWKEYPTYNHICIIRKDLKKKKFFEESASETESPYRYEIHLVSRSFRGKALLEIAYDRETAQFRAKRYAEDMTAVVAEYEAPGRAKKSNERHHRKEHHQHHRKKEDSESKSVDRKN